MNGTTVLFDKTANVLSNLRAMRSLEVLVGIPSKKTERKGKAKSPINNASLLYTFEKGSALINRPATPVVEPALKEARAKIVSAMQIGARDGLEDKQAVVKAFNKAGLIASAEIKGRIVAQEGLPTPSEEGKKYMIDTGSMLNSITYIVGKK